MDYRVASLLAVIVKQIMRRRPRSTPGPVLPTARGLRPYGSHYPGSSVGECR